MRILSLLITLSILLCSCSKKEPDEEVFQRLANKALTPEESFHLLWAEVIARTDAINKSAKEIIAKENLSPGDNLPPNKLGIINAPEGNQPGEKPYDAILEATIKGQKYTFWIHVENTVQETGATIAIANAYNPQTKEYLFYPRTTATKAILNLSIARLRNDQTEIFLSRWQESQRKNVPKTQQLQ